MILKNEDDSSHQVTVVVEASDGTTVHEETRSVSPGERWNVTTQTERGEYAVRVVPASGGGAETTYRLPLADGDRESFTTVRIRATGDVDVRSYWQD
ncbi:hypothetical protein BRD00_08650 [Halobacteriales archaeon QS_8_69_26]|nr:MAG: hypothetical protein BRD00_08650 [Halobacteriales archaeon QS_8_69_26]